jgi:uncharacterized cupredoxin-like copper-binding protein
MERAHTISIAALVAVALAVAAPGGAATAGTFAVQASDFRFKGVPKRTTHGTHVFKVRNTGRATHDFKIAGKRTRLLRSGESQTLRVTLRRGRYAYLCTVAGHAQLGMKGVLVVQ